MAATLLQQEPIAVAGGENLKPIDCVPQIVSASHGEKREKKTGIQ
jgi:hypothetical protein